MDLTPTTDQVALREALADLLTKECPPERVRATEPLGFDSELWGHVASFGVPAIAVAEELGGGGGTWSDLTVAAEELGRWLAPVPWAETAIAAGLLADVASSGDSPAKGFLERILTGPAIATVAIQPPVHGIARMVPAGAVADTVIALDGADLVATGMAEATDPTSVAAANLGSSPIADRRIDGNDRTVLLTGPAAAAAHRRAIERWQLLTAAALVGLGHRALEIGVDYVQERRAFGVLIANFQTIQHRLADNVTALDGAQLLVHEAAWALDLGLANALTLARMALLFAAEAAFRTASDSLHFHGGYGYTLEYDIQLYFRRAKAWPLIFGDPRLLARELAAMLYPDGSGGTS